jgi:hypothetical protein
MGTKQADRVKSAIFRAAARGIEGSLDLENMALHSETRPISDYALQVIVKDPAKGSLRMFRLQVSEVL